jgi:glycosyltransferase involved in cell wall biosynthesis
LDSMEAPFFTVFTPTYNRRHTLSGVYNSLKAQTCQDFEWAIVDDGSSDGTAELVQEWQSAAPFPIRYAYQQNSGKHVAWNRGVNMARGEMFVILDSDDTCVPHALERFREAWLEIPEADRGRYSTVTALCAHPAGRMVGSAFPAAVVDAHTAVAQITIRGRGERWGMNRTDLLRRYLFPVYEGERFIPEAIVWNRLARGYSTRFVNEPLRIYEPRIDGLSATMLRIRVCSPQGTAITYRELAELDLPLALRARAAVNCVRFSRHAHQSPIMSVTTLGTAVWLALAWPAGVAMYLRDRSRLCGTHTSTVRRVSS